LQFVHGMPLINFSGLASGIDTEALIQATTDAARAQKITPSANKVESLQETNLALQELKTKFLGLQSLTMGFSSLNGGALSKLATSSNETILTASASKSAPNGNYAIETLQLAKNATLSFSSSSVIYESPDQVVLSFDDTPIGNEGTLTITIGSGDNEEIVDVELDEFSTLNDLIVEFNEKSSKGQATLINAGTASNPDYRPVFTSNAEGVENGLIGFSMDGELGSLWFDESAQDQATNSLFTIAGIGGEIERSSNTVSDVLPGVSFTLHSLGSATVSVNNDTAETTASVQEFIESFNEIVEFINENNKVVREENGQNLTNIFGSLASTRVDNNALASLRSGITSSTYVDESEENAIRMFADLGITTEKEGTLAFDPAKLEEALSSEPESVNNILKNFADTVATTAGSIAQFTQFNGLFDTTVKGNEKQVSNLNDRIARAEASILRQEQMMRQRFARLEAVMGEMQNQQAALTAALSGLGFDN